MHTPPSPFGCKHWHLSPLIQKINLTAVGHCSKLHVSLFFHTLSISEHLQHNCHPPTQPTCTTAGCLLQAARVFVPPHSFYFRASSTQLSPPLHSPSAQPLAACSKLHVSLFLHTLSISEHFQHNCHPPTQPTCTTAGCLLQAAYCKGAKPSKFCMSTSLQSKVEVGRKGV